MDEWRSAIRDLKRALHKLAISFALDLAVRHVGKLNDYRLFCALVAFNEAFSELLDRDREPRPKPTRDRHAVVD